MGDDLLDFMSLIYRLKLNQRVPVVAVSIMSLY